MGATILFFVYLEHVRYVMFVRQKGCYNPIYVWLLRACSLCNVCVSGGVLQSEITFVWGATIRIFSKKKEVALLHILVGKSSSTGSDHFVGDCEDCEQIKSPPN